MTIIALRIYNFNFKCIRENVANHSLAIFLQSLLIVVSASAVREYDIDPEKGHKLSAKFAHLLSTLTDLFNTCADVSKLKTFLNNYSDPMFPEETYVQPSIYEDAQTAGEVISRLKPRYINYIQYHFLDEIIDLFGNDECKKHFNEYVQTFKRLVRKLRHHPPPITDDEIECSIGQKPLKVTRTGDVNATTPQDVQNTQEAIENATGVNRFAQVYAGQDPAFSVIFTFLIPECVEHRFHELSEADLTILADAGITKIEVGELEIENISQYCTKVKKAQKTSKPTSLEYYLKERNEFSVHEASSLMAMVKDMSENQLNKVCNDQQLLMYSKSIQNWRNLAPFLGMPDFYFDEFTTKHPTNNEQNYQLLLYWKRREPNCTYQDLLQTVILHGAVKEVRELIRIPLAG